MYILHYYLLDAQKDDTQDLMLNQHKMSYQNTEEYTSMP